MLKTIPIFNSTPSGATRAPPPTRPTPPGVPGPGDALNATDATAAAPVVAAIRLGHEVSGLAVVRDPSRASMATPDGAPVVLTELP